MLELTTSRYYILEEKGARRMVAKVLLAYNRYEETDGIEEKINEILKSSYDYQKDNMEFENIEHPDGTTEQRFVFYLDECDQRKRTEETLRKIESLLTDYI